MGWLPLKSGICFHPKGMSLYSQICTLRVEFNKQFGLASRDEANYLSFDAFESLYTFSFSCSFYSNVQALQFFFSFLSFQI